jgi:hypothetical protein
MKTKVIAMAAVVTAVFLAGFLLRGGGAATGVKPPYEVAKPFPGPVESASAVSGAVPGQAPTDAMSAPTAAGALELSEEEKKRLIEFEKSIDMIDTPSGKRPRRPF